jgi:hypothetical protein
VEHPYPVIEQRTLNPVPPRRMFSRGPRGRDGSEIPQPQANHRLVYRTHGEYVLDNSALALDSATVLEASHVAMVDVTTEAEVLVLLSIPSKDASSFTMRVSFLCTVHDPVAIVRDGATDAEAILRAYLKGHHRIFELGLDYAISEINEVRRKLNAQVKAYVTVMPPECGGMTVELASVEVLTPDELAEFERSRRTEQLKHTIDVERQHNEQSLIDYQTRYEQSREATSKRHDREVDAEQRDYERFQQRHTLDAINEHPFGALALSYTAGEIGPKEFAAEVARVQEQERADRQAELAQDREDLRARIEFEREQGRLRWEAERDDRVRDRQWAHEYRMLDREAESKKLEIEQANLHADLEFEREQRRLHWEAKRDDRVRDQQWAREDRMLDREEQRREFEAKIDIIRELAKHGHLDTANLNLDRVVNNLLTGNGPEGRRGLGKSESAALPAANDAGYADEDEKVREEDAH